jgi:hypothetical protein
MRDYKYRELLIGQEVWEPLMKTFKQVRSDSLKDCANAFHTNMERIVAFAIMPAAIAFQIRRDTIFSSNAIFRVTKKGEMTLDEAINMKLTSPEISADIEKQLREFLSETNKHEKYFYHLGVKYIENLTSLDVAEAPTAMQDSMDAVLSSVLDSWTAFESLAGDLWVAGVDNDPGEAVANLTLAAASNKLKRPDDNLRPATVYRSGVNPKTHYGSFLKAVGSVAFQTLWDIRTYYEIAFGKDTLQLFDDVDGGYIEALAAFRNVLSHSAGRADKKFIDRVRRFSEFDSIN